MGKKSSPPPPDYKPMADASAESTRVSAQLGQAQLDENKRQYEENKAVTGKVVDKQMELMDQAKAQGDSYFENWKNGRDVTDKIKNEVLTDTSADDAAHRQAIADSSRTAADGYKQLGVDKEKFGQEQATGMINTQNRIAGDTQSQIGTAASGMEQKFNAAANGLQVNANAAADGMRGEIGAAADRIGANMDKYGGDVSKAVDLYTSGNSAIVDKYGKDIEEDVGRSVADTRAGQAQATNQNLRQAMRYGISMPDATESTSLGQAQMLAAAANGTRVDSTNKYRDIVGQSVGMKQALLGTSIQAATADAGLRTQGALAGGQMRLSGATDAAHLVGSGAQASAGMVANGAVSAAGMRSAGEAAAFDARASADATALGMKAASIDKINNIASTERDLTRQDTATSMAKKLDIAGLYSGMTGASAGAYNLANNSGSSAVGNQNSTSGQYLNGMNTGTGTIMGGRQLAQGGLGSILNAQTAVATSGGGEGAGAMMGGIGGLIAGGAKAYTAYNQMPSRREYKTDIVYVGMHEIGVPIYDFSYRPEYAAKWGSGRHRGVMIDELEQVMPEAISIDKDGNSVVNYSMLGGVA